MPKFQTSSTSTKSPVKMPPSNTHSSHQDVTRVTLPSFAQFVASCGTGTIPIESVSSHILPPVLSPSLLDSLSAFIQPTNPTTIAHPSTALKELAEVRIFFYGPPISFSYGGRNPAGPAPLNPILARRIECSIPQLLRYKANGQDPPPHPASIEGMKIDLRYVDFRIDMRKGITREQFMQYLREFVPPVMSSDVVYGVREWKIVCLRCRENIWHLISDEFWNGRYLAHRSDPQCEMHDLTPPV